MKTKRNKRGIVTGDLSVLIFELQRLQVECEAGRKDATLARAKILSKFPYEPLHDLSRARQARALRHAADELTLFLVGAVQGRARAPRAERKRVVREALRAEHNKGTGAIEGLLGPMAAALSAGDLLVSEPQSDLGPKIARRTGGKTTMDFFVALQDELFECQKTVDDIADGCGPREAVYSLLARITGVGVTTVKNAVNKS